MVNRRQRTSIGRLVCAACCGVGIAACFGIVLLLGWAGCRSDSPDLGRGVRYRYISDAEGPLSIHVLEIRRDQRDVVLTASFGEAIKGKETVPDMVAGMEPSRGSPLAAVNGDYFEFKREPRFFGAVEGLCIVDGALQTGPAGAAFCIDRDGQPSIRKVRARFTITWPDGSSTPFGLNCSTADFKSEVHASPIVLFTPDFGRSTCTTAGLELVLGPAQRDVWLPLRAGQTYTARIDKVVQTGNTEIPSDGMVLSISSKAAGKTPAVQAGDTLVLNTAFDRDMADVVTAIAGGPPLIADGEILRKGPINPERRAPRTAVGFNATSIYLAVVDGRQKTLSIGMDHRELAEFMQSLGCTDALNLDGGGSSTFWLAGRVLNSPSDGRLRPVGNCLILMRQQPAGTRTEQ